MASQSGYNDTRSSGQGISSELGDLPSKRLLGKGLASIGYETEVNGERFARKDFIGVPSGIFEKEATVLVGLEDRNIVKTLGWTVDETSCSIVLEYMDDNLLDLLRKRKQSQGSATGSRAQPFELPEALNIILQISKGMEYLHGQSILHGDLKTKNILVTSMKEGDKDSLSVKVADFSLVQTKRKSMSFVSRQARKLDMVRWKAPELLKELLSEDKNETSSESDSDSHDESTTCSRGFTDWRLLSADVYSFAVTCSQILTGEDPYPNLNWKELVAAILTGELRPTLPAVCPVALRTLLNSCWGMASRPTFSFIRMMLEHLVSNRQMALPTHQRFDESYDEWFHGKPERVRYVAGRGGGYGGLYQTDPRYYSDGDDYYSHRHSGQVVHPSAATSRPMLPDVRLSVPMDSARCVEKVKEALDINGVYRVHCDAQNQTVTVSGNVAPQALLRRVKQVSRRSKILSGTSLYNNSGHIAPHRGRPTSVYDDNSGHIAPHHGRTTSAYGVPGYGYSLYVDYRSGHMPSPPRDCSRYN